MSVCSATSASQRAGSRSSVTSAPAAARRAAAASIAACDSGCARASQVGRQTATFGAAAGRPPRAKGRPSCEVQSSSTSSTSRPSSPIVSKEPLKYLKPATLITPIEGRIPTRPQ
jgi:hypothetical protein